MPTFAKTSMLDILVLLLRLFRRAAWAPLLVLIFHHFIVRTPYRVAADNPIHFMGGVAIAYFLLCALEIAAPLIGRLHAWIAYPFAYALACTVAVFWEIAEFASDQWRDTHIQSTIVETMLDLVAGVSGAFLSLSILALLAYLHSNRRSA